MGELLTATGTVAPAAPESAPAPARDQRAVVARRRHLRGLPAQLRGRQRRRHRRPRRRPLAAPLPRATSGVDAIWFTPWYRSPLADGGYDVADYRAIDPAFGTLEEAERLIAEAAGRRDPDDRRHRPQPRLDRARLVPGGARLPARAPRSGRGSGSATGRGAGRRRDADRLAVALLRHDVDADDQPRRHARRVVPAPVRAGPARPELGPPRRPTRARGRSSASGSTGASPASASTPRPCWSRTRRCPRSRASTGPGEHPNTDRDELHDDLPQLAVDRRRLPGHPRARRRAVARRTSSGSPSTSGRTSSTPRSTSTSWPGRGTPRACASRSTSRSPPTPPSARRPPGCSPTTT